jgi:hypothetical protein
VGHERVVDLSGRDLLAAAVDLLLEPAGDAEVAVVVDGSEVAGAEPAVDERALVGSRRRRVAAEDVRPIRTISPAPIAVIRPSATSLTSVPVGRPTVPGRRSPGGSGLAAIW